jgi:hypothetical protein
MTVATRDEVLELVRSVERYWLACRRGFVPPRNPLDDVDQRTLKRVLFLSQRPAYESYLRTRRWREFRALALERALGTCERCGISEQTHRLLVLDVHHKTYKRLGREAPEDVEVLCRPCHQVADRERRSSRKRR